MRQKLHIFALIAVLIFGFAPVAFGQWVWQDTGPTLNVVSSFGSIGKSLFAGTFGHGIYLTNDDGTTWSQVRTEGDNALTSSGTNLYAAGQDSGISLSIDFGKNWTPVNHGLPNNAILSLASSGTSVYAGTTDSGVYLSIDTGAHWRQVLRTPSGGTVGALAANGQNIFAGTWQGHIYRSINNGTNWDTLSTMGGPISGDIHALAIQGIDIYAAKEDQITGGVYHSPDNGTTWVFLQGPHPMMSAVVVKDSVIVAGTNEYGSFISTDNGSHWIADNTGLIGSSIQTLYIHNGYVYASVGDYGVFRRPLPGATAAVPNLVSEKDLAIYSFPNPFSQSTTIKFTTTDHSFAQVSVRDILGSEVARLFSGSLDAGEHAFIWDAHDRPAGTYFCTANLGGEVKMIPVMLVK
jgi:photosystem II stability/assembly factor-like uncharacterized protein